MGEIRIFGFSFAPEGWARCDGDLALIAQYQALFAIIGTRFGGDGRTTFGLPNLQGRSVIGAYQSGQWPPLAAVGGGEEVVLYESQLPPHRHSLNEIMATAAGQNSEIPTDNWLSVLTPRGAKSPLYFAYGLDITTTPLNPASIGAAGSSQGHENRQPYLAMNFCISLDGNWPPQE